jgi:hypothetical protein
LRPVPPRPSSNGKGIAFPDQSALDQWQQRVAGAGLTIRGLERNGGSMYLTLTGPDPERAKEFLLGEYVDRELFYIVVETPDGAWGTDIEGLYLERLRPWQLETGAADCQVPAGTVTGNVKSADLAKQGVVDNFLVRVCCGRCEHRWTDGVRYQNKTLTRCPSCGARNLVDSSNVTVYNGPDGPRPTSSLSLPFSEAGHAGDDRQREQTARRIAELMKAVSAGRAALTEEQAQSTRNWRELDSILSSDEEPPDWARPAVELRSIGHQLNREGGAKLMRETATQADGLTEHYGTVLRVIDLYWSGIGAWQG